ncbi:hypothetical protein V5O48_003439 [Marasmius crinis-equi]|uniref:Uncharacterized protein n=1 Tax=Marasmius crinis-equi TaxID=585013 RepID=A0ABR3FSU2_9AGAR
MGVVVVVPVVAVEVTRHVIDDIGAHATDVHAPFHLTRVTGVIVETDLIVAIVATRETDTAEVALEEGPTEIVLETEPIEIVLETEPTEAEATLQEEPTAVLRQVVPTELTLQEDPTVVALLELTELMSGLTERMSGEVVVVAEAFHLSETPIVYPITHPATHLPTGASDVKDIQYMVPVDRPLQLVLMYSMVNPRAPGVVGGRKLFLFTLALVDTPLHVLAAVLLLVDVFLPRLNTGEPRDHELRHSGYGTDYPATGRVASEHPPSRVPTQRTHAPTVPRTGSPVSIIPREAHDVDVSEEEDYHGGPIHPDTGRIPTEHPLSRVPTHPPSRVPTHRTHAPTIPRTASPVPTVAREDVDVLEEDHGRGPRHVSRTPPRTPRHPRTPITPIRDLHADQEVEDRLARMDDMERQLQRVAEDAEHAEDEREHQFRGHEEDRQRIFMDNEARRDEMAAEARQAIADQAAQMVPPLHEVPIPVPPPSGYPPSVRPVSVIGEPEAGEAEHISDRASTIMEVASRHGRELREIIDMEREEMAREREAHAAERVRLEDEAREARMAAEEANNARVQALEEELARVRAELEEERHRQEDERHQREIDESDLRERQRAEQEERDEGIRTQLGDITNLVNEQHALHDEKRRIMEERYDETRERRAKKDDDMLNLIAMMNKMQEDMQRDRERAEEIRLADSERPGFEQMIEELQKQNAEQRALLERLSNDWRDDCERHHQETLDAVRSTADEQIPFNVQGYLDEFSKALATEVRILLGEVGKLREERRGLQHEIGYLLCIRSKYGPGGEFEADWKPAPGQPGGPPLDPGPPPEQPPPPEPPVARPAWRQVYPRSSRKKRKEAAAAPAAPPPQTDPRTQTHSWAQWHPDPMFVPTPPSVEHTTLLVPESSSPGLFGPRSPRNSRLG